MDVNYKNKTHLESLKQARNRMDGRRRGIYDRECCTDGLEGKNWTDGQEECRQGTERDKLHSKFDCHPGMVWASNLLHLALLPL